jgi:hypothetical protein
MMIMTSGTKCYNVSCYEIHVMLYEICDSHSCEDDDGLVGCDTTWTCRWVLTFQRITLLKIKVVCFSKMLVFIFKSA